MKEERYRYHDYKGYLKRVGKKKKKRKKEKFSPNSQIFFQHSGAEVG